MSENLPRYRMFEVNMDEYLDEEAEVVKMAFDSTCKGWDYDVSIDRLYLYVCLHVSARVPRIRRSKKRHVS